MDEMSTKCGFTSRRAQTTPYIVQVDCKIRPTILLAVVRVVISYCCWVSRDVTLYLSLQWSSYVTTRRRQSIARVRYSSSRATEKNSLAAIAFSLWGADNNFRSTWTFTIYITIKNENTLQLAVRSKISSKLIFASCV